MADNVKRTRRGGSRPGHAPTYFKGGRTISFEMRCTPEVATALKEIAQATGETWADVLARLVLEERGRLK